MIFKATRVDPDKYLLAMDAQALALTVASLETAIDVIRAECPVKLPREAEMEAGLLQAVAEIKALARL